MKHSLLAPGMRKGIVPSLVGCSDMLSLTKPSIVEMIWNYSENSGITNFRTFYSLERCGLAGFLSPIFPP